jgi:hypothetical protein
MNFLLWWCKWALDMPSLMSLHSKSKSTGNTPIGCIFQGKWRKYAQLVYLGVFSTRFFLAQCEEYCNLPADAALCLVHLPPSKRAKSKKGRRKPHTPKPGETIES